MQSGWKYEGRLSATPHMVRGVPSLTIETSDGGLIALHDFAVSHVEDVAP